MNRKFFGLHLQSKQKYTFKQEQGLYCFYITSINLEGDKKAMVFGQHNDQQWKIVELGRWKRNYKCKLIVSEQNFSTLFVVGDEGSSVYLTGYGLYANEDGQSTSAEKLKHDNDEMLIYKDEFRALQPRDDRSIDSDEYALMSKKDKKKLKKQSKMGKQQE